MDAYPEISELGRRAQAAAVLLGRVSTETKDAALEAIAVALEQQTDRIVATNAQDVAKAREDGTADHLLDRLSLSPQRVAGMAQAVRELIALPDPVGEITEAWTRPNGLEIQKVRVPLGVVGIIYEARPNVTVDAATICIKSGNAVVLRGSASALATNTLLAELIDSTARSAGLPSGCVNLVKDPDRAAVEGMMKARGLIDVLIPRGGAELIRRVVNGSTVPVLETGIGNCHVYVDSSADLAKALPITFNSKTHRPSVCNAAESLLVHADIAREFLPEVGVRLQEAGVELRGCDRTRKLVGGVLKATEEDWSSEFLDLVMAVKVVDSIDEAIGHINFYGSRHTEAIVSEDDEALSRFASEVDAAAIIANASTRFTDGNEFGYGAEIGISTQKMHARGPMGLRELTSHKYLVRGDGQVRE
jgi:glutamate-5-semialdehyde dehydrogenase